MQHNDVKETPPQNLLKYAVCSLSLYRDLASSICRSIYRFIYVSFNTTLICVLEMVRLRDVRMSSLIGVSRCGVPQPLGLEGAALGDVGACVELLYLVDKQIPVPVGRVTGGGAGVGFCFEDVTRAALGLGVFLRRPRRYDVLATPGAARGLRSRRCPRGRGEILGEIMGGVLSTAWCNQNWPPYTSGVAQLFEAPRV